jgi:glucose-1-phosphate thymidylyltransferase
MRERGEAGHLDAAQAEAADAGVKAMIPFGRPFLDHVLHSLADAGIREVGLVVGPEHDQVRAYYRAVNAEKNDARRLAISFVTQPQPLGTADAVACAEAWTGGDPFLALNADNLYPVDVLARLVMAEGPAAPGFEAQSLGLPFARLGAFALIRRDGRGCLSAIVEKPGEAAVAAAGAEAWISMNVWRFDARIFEACRDVPVSARGERELPLAVGLAVSRGLCIQVFPARGPVLDLSRRADIAEVARRLEGAEVHL